MLRKGFFQKAGLGIFTTIIGFKLSALARALKIKKAAPDSFLNLNGDLLYLETPNFDLKLDKDSQTLVSLMPKGADGFDFAPSDWLNKRSGDGYYYLGDITMRLRSDSYPDWKEYSTAVKRKAVKKLEATSPVLAAADLYLSLAEDIPLNVRRYWKMKDKQLVLSYELENKTDQNVEIGALGIPMVFNNILTGRKLEEVSHKCSFYDPYIGLDAGYLQVTRLNGHGPTLVVVPEQNTPLEAYKPLLSDKTPRGSTFEGFYEWMVHTKAYADNEWKKAEQWNSPSSITLKPGDKRTYAISFLLASQIRKIEDTLMEHHRPVVIGIPGYVLPMDLKAKIFINYDQDIESISIDPIGALSVTKGKTTKNGWSEYKISGQKWGEPG